jgi:hypothetical protein
MSLRSSGLRGMASLDSFTISRRWVATFSNKRRRKIIADESAVGDFRFLPGYLHRYNVLLPTKEKTGWTWV